jgi:hypothetical protein
MPARITVKKKIPPEALEKVERVKRDMSAVKAMRDTWIRREGEA